MSTVSTRSRWSLLAALAPGVVVVLVVVLMWLTPEGDATPAGRASKTWIVQPGDRLMLFTDEVHPANVYRCSDKALGVNLEVAANGSGTLNCGGPPGYLHEKTTEGFLRDWLVASRGVQANAAPFPSVAMTQRPCSRWSLTGGVARAPQGPTRG
jgi:hypothetical protein